MPRRMPPLCWLAALVGPGPRLSVHHLATSRPDAITAARPGSSRLALAPDLPPAVGRTIRIAGQPTLQEDAWRLTDWQS